MNRVSRYFIITILVVATVAGSLTFRSSIFPPTITLADGTPRSESPYDLVQLGISGAINDLVVEKLADTGEETVLATTNKGMYIIRQQKIERFIFTPGPVKRIATIDDANGDGVRDAVVTINDSRYPNVRCYDTVSGDMLWQYSQKQRVFVEGMGWTLRHAEPTALVVIDGNCVVYAAGNVLVMLDGSNGKRLAVYDFNDQSIELSHISAVSDVDGDGADDLVAAGFWSTNTSGSREVVLYVFSHNIGRLIRSVEIDLQSSGFELYTMKPVEVQKMPGKSKALVTLSKSTISSGGVTTLDSVWLADLDTGDVSKKSVKTVLNAGDRDGDGYDELLNWDAGSASATATLEDGETGDDLWSLTVPDKLGVPQILTVGGKRVALAARLSGNTTNNKMAFAVVDTAHGVLLNDIEITTIPLASGSASSNMLSKYIYGYGDNNLLFALGSGLLCVDDDGDTLWDVPIFNDSNVVCGDITEDVLFYSHQELKSGDVVARRLIAIDGGTHRPAWIYTVSYDDFSNGGGLAYVQLVSDLNGDGKQDIAAYVKDGSVNKIVELSGKDGSVISEIALGEKIYSLDFIPYAASYSYAVTTKTASVVIDRAGAVLWSKEFAEWSSDIGEDEHVEIRVIEDLNADGVPGLITLLPHMAAVSKSNGWLAYADHKIYDMSNAVMVEYKDMFRDFNGDGVSDIVITKTEVSGTAQKTSTVVVSPVSGDEILRFEKQPFIDPAYADFNGDGFADHLVYQAYYIEGGPSESTRIVRDLYVISGRDGSELCKLAIYRNPNISASYGDDSFKMPACAVADVTGDGNPDLALYVYEVHSLGVYYFGPAHEVETYIEIYDVAQGKSVKKIPLVLPTTMGGTKSCNLIREIGDVNGNGSKDIIIDTGDGLMIADIATGQTISMFEHYSDSGGEMVDVTDAGTLCVKDKADFYYVDMINDLAITAPTAASITGSPVRLSWDSGLADSFAIVTVDGVMAGQTNAGYFDLSLTEGEHVVAIGVSDEYGKSTYAEITFSVSKGVSPAVFAIVLCVVLGTVLFLPRYVRRMPKSE
ncbi:MAG: hypothetical protein A2Z75_06365 [Chloroflexi bacterium RBG_13_50_10]|nr:MAG: hypothetical protein A2Z75_06365 [Chloroflexi bacterium RBG_13_50_10]